MNSLITAIANLMNPFAYIIEDEPTPDRLSNLGTFGTNPGSLRALTYIPKDLPAGTPLVIVLHGCKQTAEHYDNGSGWSDLADRHGFALLYPEQHCLNNLLLGFNWFRPRDNTRGSGEPLSIMHMVTQVARDHAIDRGRIFITGLSAGGHDLGDAGDLSGTVCRRGDHRGPAIWLRGYHAGGISQHAGALRRSNTTAACLKAAQCLGS